MMLGGASDLDLRRSATTLILLLGMFEEEDIGDVRACSFIQRCRLACSHRVKWEAAQLCNRSAEQARCCAPEVIRLMNRVQSFESNDQRDMLVKTFADRMCAVHGQARSRQPRAVEPAVRRQPSNQASMQQTTTQPGLGRLSPKPPRQPRQLAHGSYAR